MDFTPTCVSLPGVLCFWCRTKSLITRLNVYSFTVLTDVTAYIINKHSRLSGFWVLKILWHNVKIRVLRTI